MDIHSTTPPGGWIERLLNPMPLAAFLSEHFQRSPLVLPRTEGRDRAFVRLFGAADWEARIDCLWTRDAKSFAVARAGERIPPEFYYEDSGGPALPPMKKLFANGWSWVANFVDIGSCELTALARDARGVFGRRVWVNAYRTPPGAACFPVHADEHDVVILQMEGAKRWRVFPGEAKSVPFAGAAAPVLEEVLRAGDLMYLPAGFPHEAVALEDEDSLHLTLGIESRALNWEDLLARAAAAARREGAIPREVLPEELLRHRLVEGAVGDEIRAVSSRFAEWLQRRTELEFLDFYRVSEVPPEMGVGFGRDEPDFEAPDLRVRDLSVEVRPEESAFVAVGLPLGELTLKQRFAPLVRAIVNEGGVGSGFEVEPPRRESFQRLLRVLWRAGGLEA